MRVPQTKHNMGANLLIGIATVKPIIAVNFALINQYVFDIVDTTKSILGIMPPE